MFRQYDTDSHIKDSSEFTAQYKKVDYSKDVLCGLFTLQENITAFKRIKCDGKDVIVRGVVPRTAKIVHPYGLGLQRYISPGEFTPPLIIPSNKYRTDKFVVETMTYTDGSLVPDDSKCHSIYHKSFKYKKGHMHEPDHFNNDPKFTCDGGIYFFRNIEDAKKYVPY